MDTIGYTSLFDTVVTIFMHIYNTGVYIFGILNSTIGDLVEDTGVSGIVQDFLPNDFLSISLIELLFGLTLLVVLVHAIVRFYTSASPL